MTSQNESQAALRAKHAEESLQASEERLRLALEGARMGTFDWDLVNNRIVWSRRHEELFGLGPGEFDGTYEAFARCVHPDDLPGVHAEIARCRDARATYVHEFRVVWADGSEHWVAGLGEFTFADDGPAVRMRGVVQDITERKRAEAALRERERDLNDAQRTAHIGSWSAGLVGRITWSDEMYRIFGVTRETFIPDVESFVERVHPDDRRGLQAWLAACIAGKKPGELEFRITRPDGAIRHIVGRGELVCDAENAPLYLAGTSQDITDRKHADEARRASEEHLRLALEAAHMGTFDWDMVNNRVVWSRRHEELFGFGLGEFNGTHEAFARRVHPDDSPGIETKIERCIATRSIFAHEYRIIWPDGSEHWVAGLGEFTFADSGQPVRMRGVAMDATARKLSEQTIQATQQRLEASSEELRRLTARLLSAREEESTRIAREIHDQLGQVLTGLKLDAAWLGRHLPTDERTLHSKVSDMSALLDAAVRTVRQIAAELRPDVLDAVGLASAIEWQAEQFTERTGIQCETRSHVRQSDFRPDVSIAVFRIFQESLTNVVRHSGATMVKAALDEVDGELVLEVCDNGRGISPQDIGNPQSIGIVGMKERARLVGGLLVVAGAPGEGTTVGVRIPLQRTEPAEWAAN